MIKTTMVIINMIIVILTLAMTLYGITLLADGKTWAGIIIASINGTAFIYNVSLLLLLMWKD